MKVYLTIILIGLVSGFIGILPLLKKKADKYSLFSAFLLFFMMPYIIYHFNLSWAQWWWKGMVISVALSLPLVIASGRGNTRCVFPLLIMSFLVGLFISFVGHYLL